MAATGLSSRSRKSGSASMAQLLHSSSVASRKWGRWRTCGSEARAAGRQRACEAPGALAAAVHIKHSMHSKLTSCAARTAHTACTAGVQLTSSTLLASHTSFAVPLLFTTSRSTLQAGARHAAAAVRRPPAAAGSTPAAAGRAERRSDRGKQARVHGCLNTAESINPLTCRATAGRA